MTSVLAQCPACHATLEIPDGASTLVCAQCGRELVYAPDATSVPGFVIVNGVLREYNGDETHVIVPDHVKEIPYDVFAGTNVESVVLPEGLIYLGSSVFAHSELSEVNFPSTLTCIDGSAFYETKLTHVVLPEGLKKIGHYAFGHSQVKSVVIPSTVEHIDCGAFRTMAGYDEGFDYVEFRGKISASLLRDLQSAFNRIEVKNLKVADPADARELYLHVFSKTSPCFADFEK